MSELSLSNIFGKPNVKASTLLIDMMDAKPLQPPLIVDYKKVREMDQKKELDFQSQLIESRKRRNKFMGTFITNYQKDSKENTPSVRTQGNVAQTKIRIRNVGIRLYQLLR